jgi:hypothetical protein
MATISAQVLPGLDRPRIAASGLASAAAMALACSCSRSAARLCSGPVMAVRSVPCPARPPRRPGAGSRLCGRPGRSGDRRQGRGRRSPIWILGSPTRTQAAREARRARSVGRSCSQTPSRLRGRCRRRVRRSRGARRPHSTTGQPRGLGGCTRTSARAACSRWRAIGSASAGARRCAAAAGTAANSLPVLLAMRATAAAAARLASWAKT